MMEDRGDGNDFPLLDRQQANGTRGRPDYKLGKHVREDEFGMPAREDKYGIPVKKESRFKLKKRGLTLVKQAKSRKRALLNSVIHIPAIAITMGVLSLTFRTVFWRQPSDSVNIILNSLQFGAQVHASFVVASLSAILLHYIHHQLTSKDGVPLGFLGSVFQLSMIEYLFRREFHSLKLRYIVLFVPASLLVVLTGPASAIAMLPRLQFWNVDKIWLGKGTLNLRMYMQGNEKDLFPDTLSASNLPPRCFLGNASLQSDCPSYGMRHWLLDGNLFSISSSQPQLNKTVEGSWLRYMVGESSGVNQGISSVYSTSTLSNFFGNVLFAYEDRVRGIGQSAQSILGVDGAGTIQSKEDNLGARYDLSFRAGGKSFPSRKPLVEVECTGQSKDKTTLRLLHERMVFPPWTTAPISSAQWSVSASDYKNLRGDLNSTMVNSSWIHNEQFGDVKPSLGAVFFTPEVNSPGSCYACEDHNTNFSSYTCTVDARWMATKAFSDASIGRRAIFDSVPNPLGSFSVDGDSKKAPPITPLYLAESWTKALDVPWIDSIANPVATNRTVLDTIGQKCLEANSFINATLIGKLFDPNQPHRMTTDPMKMLVCLQVWLSLYLTEAISHTHDSVPTYFVAEGQNLVLSRDDETYTKNPYLVQNAYEDTLQYPSNKMVNITKAEFEDPSKFTELRISTSRWGYGYGFQDSILIYVGVALLLLHLLICIVYIFWILIKGDYRSAGFNSIGGLVAMAMKSNEPGEDEIDLKEKWSERIVVREVTATNQYSPITSNHGQNGKTLVLKKASTFERKSAMEEESRWD